MRDEEGGWGARRGAEVGDLKTPTADEGAEPAGSEVRRLSPAPGGFETFPGNTFSPCQVTGSDALGRTPEGQRGTEADSRPRPSSQLGGPARLTEPL